MTPACDEDGLVGMGGGAVALWLEGGGVETPTLLDQYFLFFL